MLTNWLVTLRFNQMTSIDIPTVRRKTIKGPSLKRKMVMVWPSKFNGQFTNVFSKTSESESPTPYLRNQLHI